MYVHMTQPLFAWNCLEDSPSLNTLRVFLEAVPDANLVESLEQARGRGRNDYPIHVLWGTVLLTIALRHPSTEACLGELQRNEGLRRLIGIESESGVPKKWNMSRFVETLGQEPHHTLLQKIFHAMIARLGTAVADLGCATAGDSTALRARRKKSADQRAKADKQAQGEIAQGDAKDAKRSSKDKKHKGDKKAGAARQEQSKGELPEPCGGRKEYKDDEGRVTKVLEWFGYKLHLLVDTRHEVALGYTITPAHGDDGEQFIETLAQACANLPGDRIQTAAFDKAADSEKVHANLHAQGIKPLVENRTLWKDELERKLPGHDADSNIVYDEAGTLHCYDTQSSPAVRHPMAYIGHEPARGTLKYRCPARHEGWQCPNDAVCNAGKNYGKTVRIKQELDLRRFPAIPRATKQFERLYKGRTAVERVNARLKLFWGADDGNIMGARRFHAYVGAVMVVHAAFATLLAAAPRRQGTLGKVRLGPSQKALQSNAA